MAKRKAIGKKIRFEVFKRDSFTCQYCGACAPQVVLAVDHIDPVSKGGDDDILNLITSCFDCNAGKGARTLSDDSVVRKQKAQLDELNERREQLELMLQWRKGLTDLKEAEVDIAVAEFENVVRGPTVNDNGRHELRQLVKKFGLNCVLESIQTASRYLAAAPEGDESIYTMESAQLCFSKIAGICQLSTLPEWKRELYHVRNIARKRAGGSWHPQTSALLLKRLENAYAAGIPIEDLKHLARQGYNFTRIERTLSELIDEAQYDG